ncbi:hypothetical protein [Chamaesiphon minutus]|uniref:Uncharacterized protein n=1 Tax=Chamaesiphon minutus (strain ATCC 27169 / PCC 6605) TaxID=1173020 RepID=K9UEL4_CHAP6|nr:hypothetical protein [Chamaesiphon minutus]AFY93093.1 hypothetical protein Cha6605_1988 [Chamaesiphon minutus PCC 6605]
MTNKQFPFRWVPAAFRPLGGYWIARQDGRFPDESQGSIEQNYQQWLLVWLPQNTPHDKRGV